jgi:hypothetical protein
MSDVVQLRPSSSLSISCRHLEQLQAGATQRRLEIPTVAQTDPSTFVRVAAIAR